MSSPRGLVREHGIYAFLGPFLINTLLTPYRFADEPILYE